MHLRKRLCIVQANDFLKHLLLVKHHTATLVDDRSMKTTETALKLFGNHNFVVNYVNTLADLKLREHKTILLWLNRLCRMGGYEHAYYSQFSAELSNPPSKMNPWKPS